MRLFMRQPYIYIYAVGNNLNLWNKKKLYRYREMQFIMLKPQDERLSVLAGIFASNNDKSMQFAVN